MAYLFTFAEGVMAFVSPCILPMLPVYLIYLTGGEGEKRVQNTLFFVAGFTAVFCAMGATATALGGLLSQNKALLEQASGAFMILLGLGYAGVLPLPRLRGKSAKPTGRGPLSSFLFGMAYTFGWTPCLGAFLGSALALASAKGTVLEGVALLLAFALGLGTPFLLSAFLFEKLSGFFGFLKRHGDTVQFVCGMVLCAVGISLLFRLFPYYLGWAAKLF